MEWGCWEVVHVTWSKATRWYELVTKSLYAQLGSRDFTHWVKIHFREAFSLVNNTHLVMLPRFVFQTQIFLKVIDSFYVIFKSFILSV